MVLWLTLVTMLFFAAMAMYVMNLGRHAERQQMTQDAADAAAIGAAGEVARTFNLVAANNLEMTRLIVAAQILDAMPQACAHTLADQEAMLASLLALAPPNAVPPGGSQTVAGMRDRTVADLQAQVSALTPVVNGFYANYADCTPGQLQNLAFGGNDIRENTWYQTPTGQRGTLWKAVEALDQISQAAIEKMPLTAQLGATVSGGKNLPENSRNLSGAVPVRISVPCQRGSFDDFYRPIIKGEIPAISGGSDATLHRGPYDTVFGWISEIRDPGTWVPNSQPPPSPGPAAPSDGSPFGGNVPSSPPSGTWIPGPITGYRPQGVFNHETGFFRERVGGPSWPGNGFGHQWGALPGNIGVNTHLTQRAGQIAIRKLRMAQNGASPWNAAYGDLLGRQGNAQPGTLHVPNWLFPFDSARQTARAAAGDPAAAINQRQAYATWIRIESPSRIPNASWERVQIPQSQRFFRPRPPQGQPGPPPPPVDMFFDAPETDYRIKLADGVYVIFTPTPILDPRTGEVIGTTPANPVIYLWAGINAPTIALQETPDNGPPPNPATSVAIGNPNNWTGNAQMPAPTDFLPGYASPPTAVVPGQWCVLGFAATPNSAPAWPAKFQSLNYPRHVGLAQARVFNNHSWDLWTPMWHAQLTPISQYDTWLATLQDGANQAGDNDGLNAAELPDFITHLGAVQPLAPLITH